MSRLIPIKQLAKSFFVSRYRPTIPAKSESLASRLQLMLYHRLLSSLLSSSSRNFFDWSRLYAHLNLNLNPSTPFSKTFLTSLEPILQGSSLEPFLSQASCLEHFVHGLKSFGEVLLGEQGRFEDVMEICYVMREGKNGLWKSGQRKNGKVMEKSSQVREQEDIEKAIADSLNESANNEGTSMSIDPINEEDEAQDLARAMAESLAESQQRQEDSQSSPTTMTTISDLDEVILEDDVQQSSQMDPFFPDPTSLLEAHGEESQQDGVVEDVVILPTNSQATVKGDEVPAAGSRYGLRRRNVIKPTEEVVKNSPLSKKRKRKAAPINPASTSTKTPSPPPAPPPEKSGSIIGIEKFTMSNQELDEWLTQVALLWKGERSPKGVSLEQTNRCRTCEFEEGCEWLVLKAEETKEMNRRKRREEHDRAARGI